MPQQLLAYAKANEPAELQLVNATLLYPYYQLDGNISFDLLRGSRVSQHVIPQSYLTSPEETVLESGLPVLLSIIKSDSTFDVKSIYALQDGSPRLIWHKD